jgi:long-chain acyl-CoA synthetase
LYDSDGWLRTGDIAELLPTGAFRIIDRKKHIFKLSQGEYIAPERLEAVYQQSPIVAQVFVDGSSLETYAVALVVPHHDELEKRAREAGITTGTVGFAELCLLPRVYRLVLDDMHEVGRNAGLSNFEQVKAIHLLTEPFSVENGLLTPTIRPRRSDVRKKYAHLIEGIYRRNGRTVS